jgi:hypothetical protein
VEQARIRLCAGKPQPGEKERGDKLTPEERERMYILCDRIVKEKDPEKFIELVQQVHDLLETKERWLEGEKQKAR